MHRPGRPQRIELGARMGIVTDAMVACKGGTRDKILQPKTSI